MEREKMSGDGKLSTHVASIKVVHVGFSLVIGYLSVLFPTNCY